MIKFITTALSVLTMGGASLQAEKGPREWEAELVKRYLKGGSHFATYSASAPDKEGLAKITTAMEKESGAAFFQLDYAGKLLMQVQLIPKGFPGAGLYFKVDGKNRVVADLEGELEKWTSTSHAAIAVLTGHEVEMQKKAWLTNVGHSEGHLTAGMQLFSVGDVPWMHAELTAKAKEVKEMDGVVVFTRPDKSTVTIDKKTGVFVGQQEPREGGVMVLKRDEWRTIDGFNEFVRVLPKTDWTGAEEIKFAGAPMAGAMAKAGFQGMFAAAAQTKFTPRELDVRMRKEKKVFEDYWIAVHGEGMRQPLSKRRVRLIRGDLITRYDTFKDRHPAEAEKVDLIQWIKGERVALEKEFYRDFGDNESIRKIYAQVEGWAAELGELNPEQRAKADRFLVAFSDSLSWAFARIVMDEIVKDE